MYFIYSLYIFPSPPSLFMYPLLSLSKHPLFHVSSLPPSLLPSLSPTRNLKPETWALFCRDGARAGRRRLGEGVRAGELRAQGEPGGARGAALTEGAHGVDGQGDHLGPAMLAVQTVWARTLQHTSQGYGAADQWEGLKGKMERYLENNWLKGGKDVLKGNGEQYLWNTYEWRSECVTGRETRGVEGKYWIIPLKHTYEWKREGRCQGGVEG